MYLLHIGAIDTIAKAASQQDDVNQSFAFVTLQVILLTSELRPSSCAVASCSHVVVVILLKFLLVDNAYQQ